MSPPRSPSSELPNDNHELHDGVIWAVSDPCGAPEAMGAADADDVVVADATAPAPPVADHGAPPPDDAEETFEEDAFTWLLRAMSSCAAEAGAILDLEDL